MNGYGKLRRCTDRCTIVVEVYLYRVMVLPVLRRLINRARTHYRWQPDPPHGDSAEHHLPDTLTVYCSNYSIGRGRCPWPVVVGAAREYLDLPRFGR